MLAAGLVGIENAYPLADPVDLCEQSEPVRRTRGDHVFFSFIKNKKIEWDEYRGRVTDWELNRYLPILEVGAIRSGGGAGRAGSAKKCM